MRNLTKRNGSYYLGDRPLIRGVDTGGFMVFYQLSDFVDVKTDEDTRSFGFLHFVDDEMDIKFSVQFIAEYCPEIKSIRADARAFDNG